MSDSAKLMIMYLGLTVINVAAFTVEIRDQDKIIEEKNKQIIELTKAKSDHESYKFNKCVQELAKR